MTLLKGVALLAEGTITMLSGIPAKIWLILFGIWLFSKEVQGFSKEMAIKIGEVVKTCLERIGKFLNWLVDFIKQIFEVFKPIGITTFEFAAYFTAEFSELQLQVVKLDEQRAK